MRAGEQFLFLEQMQVAPHRRLRDAQLIGETRHAHGAVLVELLEDQTEAVLLTHARTIQARSCAIS